MTKTRLTKFQIQIIMIQMFKKKTAIDYKYNEGELIKEFSQYIDSTYGKHYSLNKYQSTEFIIDSGHGEGFCIGNIMKYAMRCGKKDEKKKELMKIVHYAIIALYIEENNGR